MCESTRTGNALLKTSHDEPTLVVNALPLYSHRNYEIMTKFKRFVNFFIYANRGENCGLLPTTSSPQLVDVSPIVNSITSILNVTSGSELNIGGYRCCKRRRTCAWKADLI